MILYIQNPKDSTKKLLELINEFSKVTGYKVNIRNQLHFDLPIIKWKLRKQSHSQFIKKEKIPKNKLIKDITHPYSENYNTMKEEIKEDTNKWKNILYRKNKHD